jgi:hypothetical protein
VSKHDVPLAVQMMDKAEIFTAVLDETPPEGLPEKLDGRVGGGSACSGCPIGHAWGFGRSRPGARSSASERVQTGSSSRWENSTSCGSQGGSHRGSAGRNYAAQQRQANGCASRSRSRQPYSEGLPRRRGGRGPGGDSGHAPCQCVQRLRAGAPFTSLRRGPGRIWHKSTPSRPGTTAAPQLRGTTRSRVDSAREGTSSRRGEAPPTVLRSGPDSRFGAREWAIFELNQAEPGASVAARRSGGPPRKRRGGHRSRAGGVARLRNR